MQTLQDNTVTAPISCLRIDPDPSVNVPLYIWAAFTPFVQLKGENLLLNAALEFYVYLYLYFYSYARW